MPVHLFINIKVIIMISKEVSYFMIVLNLFQHLKNRCIKRNKSVSHIIILLLTLVSTEMYAQRKMEFLDRGLVAINTENGVFLSWRIFATDSNVISFNIYRNDSLITADPVAGKSNYMDINGNLFNVYYIEAVHSTDSSDFSAPVNVWADNYMDIPIQRPANYTLPDGGLVEHTPNDCSIGDLDGDGTHEIIVKWEAHFYDNSQPGYSGNVIFDAYNLSGKLLWRIDLGKNIRGGAHYNPFLVYDFDGDGIAEIVCKTAPGAKAGTGEFLKLGPAASDNDSAYYVTTSGWATGFVLDGPEYLTVFSGKDGRELSTVLYVPDRYPANGWGKDNEVHNRVDRFLACVSYLDGVNPCLVMCRGYYGRSVLAAWDFNGDSLKQRWVFDSQYEDPRYPWEGQGCHSITTGDVDNDGKDEIMYGAMAIDDDGSPMYSLNFHHGDASHLGDFIPDNPGLEFYMPHEGAGYQHHGITNPGVHVRDAGTGKVLWRKEVVADVGRGMTADITPDYPGCEFWASAGLGVYNSKGELISGRFPAVNFASWWDGDIQREMLDGVTISKWHADNIDIMLVADECASNNGTKATPNFSGDILGDWREEVILRTLDNEHIRIFTTTIPTEIGIYTLLQDPVYRLAMAWQNVGYNQPPHTGFYIGEDMQDPPKPDIAVLDPSEHPKIKIVSPKTLIEHPLGLDLSIGLKVVGIPSKNPVYIYSNNILIDSILSAPYISVISNIESGKHKISAKVKNKYNEWIYSDTLSITVDEGYPHISMTSPVENPLIWLGDDMLISADAKDYDGYIDSVEFYMNGQKIASLSSSPFEYMYTNIKPGSYKVYATAIDNDGKQTISDTISFDMGSTYTIIQESETGFCGFVTSGTIDSNHEGFTGSGFANTDNHAGAGVKWGGAFLEPGAYRASWRYASPGKRNGVLYLNDSAIVEVPFKGTGAWNSWDSVDASFVIKKQGYYDISIQANQGQGLGNIDYVKIISLDVSSSFEKIDCSIDEKIKNGYPLVSIKEPNKLQLISPVDSILVTVEAKDFDGYIDSVEIYLNNILSKSVKPLPFSIKISNPGTGMYQISSIAYDNSRKYSVSDSVNINISDITFTIQEQEQGFCDFNLDIESVNSGFTGSGYVNPYPKKGADITWAVDFPEKGIYSLYWRYSFNADVTGNLRLNDTPVKDISFNKTEDFNTWGIVGINLEIMNAGLNKISLRSNENWGMPNIDYIKIVQYNESEYTKAGQCDSLTGITSNVIEIQKNILIYPSPVHNHVSIKLKNSNEDIIKSVEIFSVDGTPAITKKYVSTDKIIVNTTNLSNGIYVLRINTIKGSLSQKIVIVK